MTPYVLELWQALVEKAVTRCTITCVPVEILRAYVTFVYTEHVMYWNILKSLYTVMSENVFVFILINW